MITFKMEDGDYVINSAGRLTREEGFGILQKNINKILRTYKESAYNSSILFRYNPNYGVNIPFLRALNGINTEADQITAIQDDLTETVLYYDKLQREKIKYGITNDSLMSDSDITVYSVEETSGGIRRKVIKYDVEVVASNSSQQQLLLTGEI